MSEEISLKETQKISYQILKTIADICEEKGLRYYLIYGTLIGVIRHQDYIPWDDDLDIMMPRPDYDQLIDYLSNHADRLGHLKLFCPENCPEYPYMIARVSDDRYKIVMDNEKPYGLGVFIDIYPFDGLGTEKKAAIRYGLKGDRLSSLCYQSTRNHFGIENTTSGFRKLIKLPVFLFSKACGKDFFQKKLQKLSHRYPYDSSKYVGCVVWLSGGIKDIFPRSWFDEYEMKKFGADEFRIPKKYDKILKHVYGDYMQLPPEKDRVGHHNYYVIRK